MKTHYTVTWAMLAGFGLGAIAVQGLHKPGPSTPPKKANSARDFR
jgi:hypothetical protein